MIIDPFLNNPKKLDYQLSDSIYKPKTKKIISRPAKDPLKTR